MKYKSLLIIIIGLTSIFLVGCSKRVLSGEEVFNKYRDTVVELHSYNLENLNESYGTGIILNISGDIITNKHLIQYKQFGIYNNYDLLEIRLVASSEWYQVELKKVDEDKDLALLSFDNVEEKIKDKLISISVDPILSGSDIFVIGNNMNFGIGITKGTVSIASMIVKEDENIISVTQLDITISDGCSGGAVINSKGELIGIISFRVNDEYGNTNYGFAFSISSADILMFIQ